MTQSNILFTGMHVYKESIVISLANDDRSEIRRYGSIGGTITDFKKHYISLYQPVKNYSFVMSYTVV